jgi:hypothetical protein
MILSYMLVMRHNHILSFLFTSRSTPLLASNRASVFYGTFVFTQYINIISTNQEIIMFNLNPSWFSCIFLMAYSTAMLRSNDNKVISFFQTILNRKCINFYLCILYYTFCLNTFELAKLV